MSTNETQAPTSKAEWLFLLYKIAPVFLFMGIALWVLFAWVQDGREQQNERITKLEQLVEECVTGKQTKLEAESQEIKEDVKEILNRIPEK